MSNSTFSVSPVGEIQSSLKNLTDALRQGSEGAPEAWITIKPAFARAMHRLEPGDDVVVLTWFHLSDRTVLEVHPRNDTSIPLTGVFATRSPDRPNPIGLHRVRVLEISENRLRVAPIEAIDGTPVIDIKPVLDAINDS
ncbi:MAG: tRNA (N6-threonylcarbamoyladenosine(37)-N6)-methyltransferase TrmO [Leptospirales bacterium]|nr:tRNA (N6-threonylcarbamoyladenosine(37)-N6)-methyltransferase TrmO [Leptospirales bacterium]